MIKVGKTSLCVANISELSINNIEQMGQVGKLIHHCEKQALRRLGEGWS